MRPFAEVRKCCSVVLLCAFSLSGCAVLPAAGPTIPEVETKSEAYAAPDDANEFLLVNIDKDVVDAASVLRQQGFTGHFTNRGPAPYLRIAVGDMLQIAIIEVGGGIFGQSNNAATLGSETVSAQTTTLQPFTVARDGYIDVPFAGRIHAEGQTPDQVKLEIEHLLAGKALKPQVEVAVTSAGANSVTVGGEVNHPGILPVPIYGGRVLDLIAAAGGARFPPYETDVHLTRHGRTVVASLQDIVEDQKQNIYTQPRDSLFLTHQPRTFTAFGATSKVGHYPFEAARLNLAEAVAKAGGSVDKEGDPAGAYLFRYEPADFVACLRPDLAGKLQPKVPVVYHLNLRNSDGYFYAQSFPVRDKDVILIADAEGTQLAKFFILLRGVSGVLSDLKSVNGSGGSQGNF